MKRGREDETLDMVNCLMLLSRVGDTDYSATKNQKPQQGGSFDSSATKSTDKPQQGRVFACKTCNREFPSFQALGGHRASHKKPKLMPGGAAADLLHLADSPASPAKPKTHECPICGVEFAVGQALGGHMRRHRDVIQAAAVRARPATPMPVLKKSNSSKRVSCLNLDDLDLDLNLAPPGHHHRHHQLDLTTLQLIT